MKKLILILMVALALAVYFGSTKYGLELGGVRLMLDPSKEEVLKATRRFLEDIQFKDFTHAGSFHTEEDQKKKDIPALIERKFGIKPEQLDIRHFEVLRIDISSSGDRAKALTRTTSKVLNSKQVTGKEQVREVDIVWYWKKVDGKWFMDLQSSL